MANFSKSSVKIAAKNIDAPISSHPKRRKWGEGIAKKGKMRYNKAKNKKEKENSHEKDYLQI